MEGVEGDEEYPYKGEAKEARKKEGGIQQGEREQCQTHPPDAPYAPPLWEPL